MHLDYRTSLTNLAVINKKYSVIFQKKKKKSFFLKSWKKDNPWQVGCQIIPFVEYFN